MRAVVDNKLLDPLRQSRPVTVQLQPVLPVPVDDAPVPEKPEEPEDPVDDVSDEAMEPAAVRCRRMLEPTATDYPL